MVVALQLVQARLADVRGELPAATTLVAERLTPTSFPVLTVSVEGALPPERLRDVALYQVRPALSRVAGVGPISVTAGEVREVEVEVDPARAEAAGLTADGIADKLAASNSFATVGRADVAYRRYAIVVSGVAPTVARLGDFVVGGSERAPVRLADVATIAEGHADPRLLVRSPRGASAVVNVARRIGGDVVALDAGLRAALDELRTQVPTGVVLTPVYEQATLIGAATAAVRDAILARRAAVVDRDAALLALAARHAGRGARHSLVAGGGVRGHPRDRRLAQPHVARRPGHRRRARHRRRGGRGRGHPSRARAPACRRARRPPPAPAQLAGPVISSTLTTVVVFAPLGFLSGVVGAFFAALAIALAAAVVLSLVIALTVIPMLVGARCSRPTATSRRAEPLVGRYVPLLAPRARPPPARRRRRRASWRSPASPAPRASRAASSPRWTRARSCSTSSRPSAPRSPRPIA